PIAWISCRKCGAGLMDPRDQYGVERNLPAAKVTLTAEILNAPGNRWTTDIWGYLPKSEG
ncbi:MAG: hypothetical protein NTY05_06525, partial [Rhodocyclales bacterium]|nr:hypothetical protein [Rhodocyclales bacterium]